MPGVATPWSATPAVVTNDPGEAAHTGSWKGWMDGYGTTHTDTLSQTTGFSQRSFALSGVAGSTVTLSFSGTEDTSLQTSFVVDDAALIVS